jgi:acyl-CoA dehydrogenase
VPCIADVNQNDNFLFNQGQTKGLGKIKFHDYQIAYKNYNLPNVKMFRKQISMLKKFLIFGKPNKDQVKDIDFLLILGELFTLVAYGQLILENCKIMKVSNDMVDQIFDFMIRDFSKFALQLYSKTSSTAIQKRLCRNMIMKPVVNKARFDRMVKEVYSNKGAYTMNE